MNGIRFRTRARTIDHLGQSQIADCPTAISELWKNAYDAYAQDVALHIFDGERPMAAVVDNGHGMSPEEFVERWLVVGTESKAASRQPPEEDRFGLPLRIPQGQKGIGRLSVAYLGPLVLVLSKRQDKDFVASLIDWRVFENPYLLLEDVIIPVERFADMREFSAAFERMRNLLSENVWPAGDSERRVRLERAWEQHDEDRVRSDKGKLSDEIAESVLAFDALTEKRLQTWLVWAGKSPCGTALYVLDIRRELKVWVDPGVSLEDEEAQGAKSLLTETLVSFIDPYLRDSKSDFRYEVVTHHGDLEKRPIQWDDTLSIEEVRELEHVVEGEIDESGTFRGTIRAFGKDLGTAVLPPSRQAPRTEASYVGPYKFLAATFEQEARKSALIPEIHALWEGRTKKFAGLAIYRDELRIQPYGRARGDVFEIEERRNRHAGRNFWYYRRLIGRISLTRQGNPNLIDKAGREGLKDNQAFREFKLRVMDLLGTTARRYFGTDSPDREENVRENEERHRAALKDAGRRSLRQLRSELKKKEPELQQALKSVDETLELVKQAVASNPSAVRVYEDAVDRLRKGKSDLAVGAPPRKLDGDDEDRYRSYRDQYRTYRAKIDELYNLWTNAVANIDSVDPVKFATRKHDEYTSELERLIHDWRKDIHGKLDGEKNRIAEWGKADAARFPEATSALLVELATNKVLLSVVLSRFEMERENLRQEVATRYDAYIRALDRLIEGVDVEGALRWSSDEIEALKDRVSQVHSLAQLGVTVEIIGHEFETLDAEVRRGLNKLPREAQATDAFRVAKHAHLSLTQKLRFLSPLKLSGPRLREKIRGKEIAKYMFDFFGERLKSARAELTATDAFNGILVTDFRSRLYPVFINLINNALYWLTFAERERRIVLDFMGEVVIVADSGRGVDPDDLPKLFKLFFSRRVDGHGVGLYLCRENLGAGGHTIDYSDTPEYRVLPGANFVIRFRGIEHG